jgi:hypothetical protein
MKWIRSHRPAEKARLQRLDPPDTLNYASAEE